MHLPGDALTLLEYCSETLSHLAHTRFVQHPSQAGKCDGTQQIKPPCLEEVRFSRQRYVCFLQKTGPSWIGSDNAKTIVSGRKVSIGCQPTRTSGGPILVEAVQLPAEPKLVLSLQRCCEESKAEAVHTSWNL